MTTGPGQRRPDESMTLLTSMLERPLDAGYQEAADRRDPASAEAGYLLAARDREQKNEVEDKPGEPSAGGTP